MITFPTFPSLFWGPRLGALITNMLFKFNADPEQFITSLWQRNQQAFAQGAEWGVPKANMEAALKRQGWLAGDMDKAFQRDYEDSLSYEAGRHVFDEVPIDVPLTRDLFEGTPYYFPEEMRTMVDANYFYRVDVTGRNLQGDTLTVPMTVTSMEPLTKEQIFQDAASKMQEAENAGTTFPVRGYADLIHMEFVGAVHKRGEQW